MSDLSKILLAQAKYFRGTENYIIKEALDVYVENEEDEVIELAVKSIEEFVK